MTSLSLCLIFLLAAGSRVDATPIPDRELRDAILQTGVEPYIFEKQILEKLEKLRHLLQYGDPENNIPPLEPLHIDNFDFDFILNDTALAGYFRDVSIPKVSNFNVTEISFRILPSVRLTISLFFETFNVDGLYHLVGDLFDTIPLNGRGRFKSTTSGLLVNFLVDMTSKHHGIVIKDLNVSFTVVDDEIEFTNEDAEGETVHVPDEVALEILDRVQSHYFPLLLNTLTLVANDLLYNVSIDDIIHLITGH